MDWLSILSTLVLSQWSAAQESPEEPFSLRNFVHNVCSKLAKLLQETRPLQNVPGTAVVRGLLLSTLTDFRARLNQNEQDSNEDDKEGILRALEKLEELCQVSNSFT